jgi:hypothetical protein
MSRKSNSRHLHELSMIDETPGETLSPFTNRFIGKPPSALRNKENSF